MERRRGGRSIRNVSVDVTQLSTVCAKRGVVGHGTKTYRSGSNRHSKWQRSLIGEPKARWNLLALSEQLEDVTK
ncbi:hypothetical protein D4R75_16135 [bacterium]|nr:MAG: hypothetical protein D4R75_16135 [bacterium]